ncbi:hypothetical protein [Dyadobacter sp. NIV53]|uniref:hypothetical protein n=1 Tax=Dyadobacter sp. NIV53 TaxID=2861765 RepID=UPI001C8831A6|nr:hypothetical protein [Dyadobacter sp. NIV53]
MGAADDFIHSFFKLHPHLQSGQLSLDELNRLMAIHQNQINNRPLADFDSVSPSQMDVLLNQPLSDRCILQIREHVNNHFSQVPLLRLSDLLIGQIYHEGSLKLTTKGNLPVRVCELLYNQHLISWKYMAYAKRILEEEIPYLWPLKHYLLSEGIVKKRGNTLSLTQKGEKFRIQSDSHRFENLLLFFGSTFHWGNFYDYPDEGRYGQLGWAFSLVLLARYADQPRSSQFYSLKLMQAFEKQLWENHQAGIQNPAVADFHLVYDIRFVESFAHWFGLVNIERKNDQGISFFDQLTITKTNLFDSIFVLTDK